MAYKYFTEQLLMSDVDLTSVFSEKQEFARQSNNVSYSLMDIAVFLKDRTENFKKIEAQYVDLDNAISQIINKYYVSKGEKNPFLADIDDEALKDFESKTPREAAIVEKGEIKGKGAPKAAPDVVIEKVDKKTPKKDAAVSVEEKIDKFKKELEGRKEIFDDVYDDEEKADFIQLMQDKLDADEIVAEDGDEYYVQRVQILKDFIKQLKK